MPLRFLRSRFGLSAVGLHSPVEDKPNSNSVLGNKVSVMGLYFCPGSGPITRSPFFFFFFLVVSQNGCVPVILLVAFESGIETPMLFSSPR